jgi:hypothetical protein
VGASTAGGGGGGYGATISLASLSIANTSEFNIPKTKTKTINIIHRFILFIALPPILIFQQGLNNHLLHNYMDLYPHKVQDRSDDALMPSCINLLVPVTGNPYICLSIPMPMA